MTKKIAVIGCSHSDLTQPNRSWIYGFSKYDVEVHSYAMSGQGLNYHDFVLKYICNHCPDQYDAAIVQLTGTNRWWIPTPIMEDPDRLDILSNEVYPGIIDKKFKAEWRYSNTPVSCHDSVSFNTWIARNGLTGMHDLESKLSDSWNSIVTQWGMEFIKFLDVYEKIFPNFFYFGWQWENNNNISGDTQLGSAHEFLRKKYGDFGLAGFLDDTLHLTDEGNSVFFNEYIMNSKIGDYLKNECGLKQI
jgi:hypothetical protein